MSYQDWLPTSWTHHKEGPAAPLVSLREQVDSLFNDFDKNFFAQNNNFSVRSNVSETDKEICITAELPGLSEEDVDVSVVGNQITIKGEKKSEVDEKTEEEGRQFHRIERSSGSFQRVMSLPFEIDSASVKADVKQGVLTVKIPKPAEIIEKTKKIKVTQSS